MGFNNQLYGYIEDYYDPRDKIYRVHERPLSAIPDSVDLRSKWKFAVEQQGGQGSCAANATASCTEYILSTSDKYNSAEAPEISRSFLYYLARKEQGWQNRDSGSLLRDNIKVAAKYGVATEFCMPYNENVFNKTPEQECLDEAARHKIGSYYRMSSLDEYIDCLAKGYPFVFGIYVYQDFMDGGNRGFIAMPSGKELGAHAVVGCGYNKTYKYIIGRNSWGTRWGDGGYFYIPFDYMISDSYLGDCWAVRDIKS